MQLLSVWKKNGLYTNELNWINMNEDDERRKKNDKMQTCTYLCIAKFKNENCKEKHHYYAYSGECKYE